MAATSLAHLVHPVVPEETRERGTCSGCGTTTKTLTAPAPNVEHGYEGPMYCLPCNPRSLFHPGRPMVLLGQIGGLIGCTQ